MDIPFAGAGRPGGATPWGPSMGNGMTQGGAARAWDRLTYGLGRVLPGDQVFHQA